MLEKFVSSLLGKNSTEPLVSVDIGSSAIKLMSVDTSGSKFKLLSAGTASTPAGALNNNAVSKPEQIGTVIRSVMEANDIRAERAVVAIPGPAVFTKKITIGYTGLEELENNIAFEASNYIPHSIDAVHLDYQIVASSNKSTMDVLLVAVKNEIINSYLDVLQFAGLEAAIADVDYFAVENMFAINYPEEKRKTIALVNIGSRYTSVSIVQDGQSLFTGDVGVGGRLYTDALCETLGMKPVEAEQAKMGAEIEGYDPNLVSETMDRTTEHLASEIHRQLGFFWNAAATERSIEGIFVCGGGAQSPGLLEELSARTGMACNLMQPFKTLEWSDNFDVEYIDEISTSMGVSVGLALRRRGDKEHVI